MKQILIMLAIAAFLTSCSKEKQPSPQPSSKKMLELNNLTLPDLSARYAYNAEGQLLRISQGRYASIYQHSAGSFYFKQVDTTNNSVLSERINGVTDAYGRVIAFTRKYKLMNGTMAFQNEKFKYHADGYLVEYFVQKPDLTEVVYRFEYQDGNLIKTITLQNGLVAFVETYTYYIDKAAMTKVDMFGQKRLGFQSDETFGKSNKNLLQSYKEGNAQGQVYYHMELQYNTDAQGYPVSMTKKSVLTGTTENLAFAFL